MTSSAGDSEEGMFKWLLNTYEEKKNIKIKNIYGEWGSWWNSEMLGKPSECM